MLLFVIVMLCVSFLCFCIHATINNVSLSDIEFSIFDVNDGILMPLANTGLLNENTLSFSVTNISPDVRFNAQLLEYNLDDTVMLTSVVLDRTGDYTVSFKPNGSGVMKLKIYGLNYTGNDDLISVKDLYTTVTTYTSQNITTTICNNGGDRYRFGFNGMEKDNELKGTGNSLDFGARMYDSRLGRWLSLDPLATKYPHVSPYAFVGNSPIVLVDPNGKEWVNYHTIEIARLQSELLKTPNDKNLLLELSDQLYYQQKVNDALSDFKENAQDRYNYIDGLKVQMKGLDNMSNVKVIVRFDIHYKHPGTDATAATLVSEINKERLEFGQDASYNGKGIYAPMNPEAREGQRETLGFSIILYNSGDLDLDLANEVGDVKYYMEYNDQTKEEHAQRRKGRYNYWSGGSSAYSFDEEKSYGKLRDEKRASKKLDKQIENDVKDGLKHKGTNEVDPNKTGQRLGDN